MTHFDVIGFTGKHGDGLALRLPSEACNRAVVPAAIRNPDDSKHTSHLGGLRVSQEDLSVLFAVQNP